MGPPPNTCDFPDDDELDVVQEPPGPGPIPEEIVPDPPDPEDDGEDYPVLPPEVPHDVPPDPPPVIISPTDISYITTTYLPEGLYTIIQHLTFIIST